MSLTEGTLRSVNAQIVTSFPALASLALKIDFGRFSNLKMSDALDSTDNVRSDWKQCGNMNVHTDMHMHILLKNNFRRQHQASTILKKTLR